MTIQNRLVLRFAILLALCLAMLAGLAYHEIIVETHERAEALVPEALPSSGFDYAEVFFYGMIPVMLGVGWWITRRTLQPIDQFARRIERIHASNLSETLLRSGNGDEIDRLTKVFNEMTQRLNRTFQHTREFALYASHELKTPLAVMRTEFEVMRKDPSSAPSCRTCSETRLEEIERMARMLDSVTLLTKADVGLIDIERKRVVLSDLVAECYEDAVTLAEPHDVTVTLEACDSVAVLGDRHRLRQLLLNLADNAVKYNQLGGLVTLSLKRKDFIAELTFMNTGPGIPPELQRRVFERFVRGPDARERTPEGCGLGLAICDWIVHAHRGTIEIESQQGGLTVATVRLPALKWGEQAASEAG